MKSREIVDLFHISKQLVNFWINHFVKKRKRRTKLTRNKKNLIVKWANDKPIMENKVSDKNIQIRFNKLRNKFKENKKEKIISLSTTNRILNKHIGKPRLIRRIFYLKPYEKNQRVLFCKFMKKNNIGPENIFFTDEIVFPLKTYLNKGTNKIRLSEKTRRNSKSSNEKSINLVIRQTHKFNNAIMVSGGICV